MMVLQAAIREQPDYGEAHNNLGVLQRDIGAIPVPFLAISPSVCISTAAAGHSQSISLETQ